jgi:t-SNARE complex subunit (syntaxin)|tara:strand:+ start:224 stop:379 length:156 start_codon:yes stop_codon:yes gene_type:complete
MQKLMKANNREKEERKKQVDQLEKRIADLESLFIVKLHKFIQRIVRKIPGF